MSDLDWAAVQMAASAHGYGSAAEYVMQLIYDDARFREARRNILEKRLAHFAAIEEDERRAK